MSARARFFIVSMIGACAVTAACLDLSRHAPPDTPSDVDAAIADTGADVALDVDAAAIDADLRPACQRCVESPDLPGPGCGDELARCLAEATCRAVYACVVARACLTKDSQKKMLICGIPCASEAGVTSPSDPAAVLALQVIECAQSNCIGACRLGDAGID